MPIRADDGIVELSADAKVKSVKIDGDVVTITISEPRKAFGKPLPDLKLIMTLDMASEIMKEAMLVRIWSRDSDLPPHH